MPERLKLSVGYQLPDPYRFADWVAYYAADIEEVYFPWLGIANGRGISIAHAEEQRLMEKELADIRACGVRLNLLWNATCYGGQGISGTLEERLQASIRSLLDTGGLACVTTASLFIAERVKRTFPEIEVRASVNMGIGSVMAMKAVGAYFDGFYIKRELNRFPADIRPLRAWCDANGKRLYLLANSGCLRECPAHTFHDNLVAHENEGVCEPGPWDGFRGICWDYYAQPANHVSFLADSTWIRPEEIDAYEGLVDGVKLATRMHRDPEQVIASYVRRTFSGNLLGLCEPDFSGLCDLENDRFSKTWLKRFGELSESERVGYCNEELQRVRRPIG